jgi:phosphatidylserine/phosphatidylglycerophosphate/cardiolipin synthase-like enzyme
VTNGVIQELGTAKSTVRVLAYGMTSAPIANALVEAKKRGADVQVVLDYKENFNQKSSKAQVLIEGGIPVLYDKMHAIAHNKIMVIDDKDVITGSFNFTTAAENNNAENLIILNSPDLAKTYSANWQLHHDHSITGN